MLSDKKIKLFRFLGHLTLVFLIILVCTLTVLSTMGKADFFVSFFGGVLVLSGVLAMFFTQKKIDALQSRFLLQTDFAQDKAFVSLFDRSPVAYVIIQINGTIASSNPAAANLLQREVNAINGVNFFDLIQTDSGTDANVLQGKIEAG